MATGLGTAIDAAVAVLAASPTVEAQRLAFRYRVGRLTLQDLRTIVTTVELMRTK